MDKVRNLQTGKLTNYHLITW